MEWLSPCGSNAASVTSRIRSLPKEATDFIGRSSEVRQTRENVKQHQTVTLTLPAGTGKTRLSVAVGGTAGALLYLPVPRLLARYLGGAGGFDALSIVGSLLLITVAVTSAAVGPALRAARVPPAEVLRRS